jgi:hypothetical protein
LYCNELAIRGNLVEYALVGAIMVGAIMAHGLKRGQRHNHCVLHFKNAMVIDCQTDSVVKEKLYLVNKNGGPVT